MKKQWIAGLLMLCMTLGVFSFGVSAEGLTGNGTKVTAESLLAGMTLEQKIAQMLMPTMQTWTGANGKTSYVTSLNPTLEKAIKTYGFGGIILFAENAAGTAQTAELISDLQNAAKGSASGIPMLVSLDQEGGYVVRLGTGTSMCGNMALAATGDAQLAEESAAVMGRELSALGFNVDFAPVLDVNNNPGNPIIGVRSFSDDPATAAKFGSAFIRGLQGENVSAALKHFPGHGDTVTDSHSGLPLIDKSYDAIRGFELVPFAEGIRAGADIIMTAHIRYPQIEKQTYVSKSTGERITLPATLSKTILTDILRGDMGFDGVIITDSMQMAAIMSHFKPLDAAKLAINAGADMLLAPVDLSSEAGIAACGTFIKNIASMVRSGEIAENTVNAAVLRILELKIRRGIIGGSFDKAAMRARALNVVGCEANHAFERTAAEKSVTLVKNENGTLPVKLGENGKAVLFCAYTNEIPAMNYAVSLLKQEGVIPESAQCSVYCYQGHTAAEYKTAVQNADAVIAATEQFRTANLTGGFQTVFLDAMIDLAHTLGKKITVVSIQLPYDLARYQKADALMAVYNSEGMRVQPKVYNGETAAWGPSIPAAVCAAFGSFTPTGTLPVDIPKLNASHVYTDEVLYARGFGLRSFGAAPVTFSDVPDGQYYSEPIAWAAEKGFINGVGNGLFLPMDDCTRGQAVTVLYRAAGSPAFRADNIFSDVVPDSFYEKAVVWATEMGYVNGVGGGLFLPDEPCTRGQFVTILYRYSGAAANDGVTAFPDVPADAFYAQAVKWAAEQGITGGNDLGMFCPDDICTRAHLVTFLYRYLHG